jgi:hypothetical protein
VNASRSVEQVEGEMSMRLLEYISTLLMLLSCLCFSRLPEEPEMSDQRRSSTKDLNLKSNSLVRERSREARPKLGADGCDQT